MNKIKDFDYLKNMILYSESKIKHDDGYYLIIGDVRFQFFSNIKKWKDDYISIIDFDHFKKIWHWYPHDDLDFINNFDFCSPHNFKIYMTRWSKKKCKEIVSKCWIDENYDYEKLYKILDLHKLNKDLYEKIKLNSEKTKLNKI